MRRSELAIAIEQVAAALKSSGMDDAITAVRGSNKAAGLEAALEAMRRYAVLAESYTPTAKRLAHLLDLDPLLETRFWMKVFAATDSRPDIGSMVSDVWLATKVLPKLLSLINDTAAHSVERAVDANDDSPVDYLRILLFEDPSAYSRPSRVATLMLSVEKMYEGCALLLDARPEDLTLVGCDSGSDKAFDFLGAAKVIECVKELILSMWDRVVFFREYSAGQRVKLIAESLPVLTSIKQMEDSGALSAEMAGVLRLRIVDGASDFLAVGATIPEIEAREQHDSRGLLAPERKLLANPGEPADAQHESADDSSSGPDHPPAKRAKNRSRKQSSGKPGLSRNELTALRRLVDKALEGEPNDED